MVKIFSFGGVGWFWDWLIDPCLQVLDLSRNPLLELVCNKVLFAVPNLGKRMTQCLSLNVYCALILVSTGGSWDARCFVLLTCWKKFPYFWYVALWADLPEPWPHFFSKVLWIQDYSFFGSGYGIVVNFGPRFRSGRHLDDQPYLYVSWANFTTVD